VVYNGVLKIVILLSVLCSFAYCQEKSELPTKNDNTDHSKNKTIITPFSEHRDFNVNHFLTPKPRLEEERIQQSTVSPFLDLMKAYAITFGWALIGSISMGVGIIITLKMVNWCHKEVDEWQLIKDGNIPMAIIMAALIIALGMVVASVTRIN